MQYPGITGPVASRTIPHRFGDPFDFIITRQAPSPVIGNGQERQDCDSINDKKCLHENPFPSPPYCQKLTTESPEKQILFRAPLLTFRKAQRGREKIGSEEKRTPPPKPTKDMCLMITSKMTFLPGLWNHLTFDLYHLFVPQLIWSSASADGNSLPSLYPLSSSQGERLG